MLDLKLKDPVFIQSLKSKTFYGRINEFNRSESEFQALNERGSISADTSVALTVNVVRGTEVFSTVDTVCTDGRM